MNLITRDTLMVRPYEEWKLSRLGREGIAVVVMKAYRRCIKASLRTP